MLNHKGLKEMCNNDKRYFDDLLKGIKDIRSLEKRFGQMISDIYTTLVDYYVKYENTHKDLTVSFALF